MKLYDGGAPSPRRVRIFIAEKGLDIPKVELDLTLGDNRHPDFLKLNSLGQVPLLELDDGTAISESIAICRYLEELHPEPALFGRSAIERAHVEMWNRRMENEILGTLANVAMHTLPYFKDKGTQVPAFAEAQREVARAKWAWLDGELSDGRAFVAGTVFSIADITGMAASMVAEFVDLKPDDGLRYVRVWEEALRSRHSWAV